MSELVHGFTVASMKLVAHRIRCDGHEKLVQVVSGVERSAHIGHLNQACIAQQGGRGLVPHFLLEVGNVHTVVGADARGTDTARVEPHKVPGPERVEDGQITQPEELVHDDGIVERAVALRHVGQPRRSWHPPGRVADELDARSVLPIKKVLYLYKPHIDIIGDQVFQMVVVSLLDYDLHILEEL